MHLGPEQAMHTWLWALAVADSMVEVPASVYRCGVSVPQLSSDAQSGGLIPSSFSCCCLDGTVSSLALQLL